MEVLVARTVPTDRSLNTIVLTRALVSTFAQNQFAGLASHLTAKEFKMWCISVFGSDIPIDAYEDLRLRIDQESIPNPPIKLVPPGSNSLEGHAAGYNRPTKQILVDDDVVTACLTEEESNWKLLVILVEEYGHYLDQFLREELSSVGGDAPFDEGAIFAHSLLLMDYDRSVTKEYATLIENEEQLPLTVEYAAFSEAVQKYLSQEELADDASSEDTEYFGAGRGKGKPGESFGHESIEDQLKNAGFTEIERAAIYFGNWERDYSQIVDPKIGSLTGQPFFHLQRKTLTDIVNVFAELKFGTAPHFKVKQNELGVYRPEEHIDNPRGIEDGSSLDPAYRKACTASEISIDTSRRMKRYIATPGPWQTSTGYMTEQLQLAGSKGRNMGGLRHMGNALHTLEDFFAHSNFVELALIKMGFSVDPWVPLNGKPSDATLTTGTFGGLDTAASILSEIGEALTKTEPFTPGKRTTGQRITLILLRDKMPNLAKYYESFLELGEEFEKVFPYIGYILHETVGKAKGFFEGAIGLLILAVCEVIDDYQKLVSTDSNSTDPSHTQLAKDHDEHPLHQLAAQLASEAVRQVGVAMVAEWNGTALKDSGGFIGSVHFGKDQSSVTTLSSIGMTELDGILAALRSGGRAGDRMIVTGHASAEGSDELNLGLSQNRADSVADYLLNHSSMKNMSVSRRAVGEKGASADDPVWRRVDVELQAASGTNQGPASVARGFLVHPYDTSWMDQMVKKWGNEHPSEIKRAKVRTVYDEELKEIRARASQWATAFEKVRKELFDWMENK